MLQLIKKDLRNLSFLDNKNVLKKKIKVKIFAREYLIIVLIPFFSYTAGQITFVQYNFQILII